MSRAAPRFSVGVKVDVATAERREERVDVIVKRGAAVALEDVDVAAEDARVVIKGPLGIVASSDPCHLPQRIGGLL